MWGLSQREMRDGVEYKSLIYSQFLVLHYCGVMNGSRDEEVLQKTSLAPFSSSGRDALRPAHILVDSCRRRNLEGTSSGFAGCALDVESPCCHLYLLSALIFGDTSTERGSVGPISLAELASPGERCERDGRSSVGAVPGDALRCCIRTEACH